MITGAVLLVSAKTKKRRKAKSPPGISCLFNEIATVFYLSEGILYSPNWEREASQYTDKWINKTRKQWNQKTSQTKQQHSQGKTLKSTVGQLL